MIYDEDGNYIGPDLEPKLHEVIVPCRDAEGWDCGWHVMDDQIDKLLSDSYKLPEYVKVKIGNKDYIFRRATQEEYQGVYLIDENLWGEIDRNLPPGGDDVSDLLYILKIREVIVNLTLDFEEFTRPLTMSTRLDRFKELHLQSLQSRVIKMQENHRTMQQINERKRKRTVDSALRQGGLPPELREIISSSAIEEVD